MAQGWLHRANTKERTLIKRTPKFDFNELFKFFFIALFAGAAASLFLAFAIMSFSLFDFGNSFSKLHEAFFSAGTYSFDPSFEKIVVLYPQNLFQDVLKNFLTGIFLSSIVIIIFSSLVLSSFFKINLFKKI